MKVNYIFFRSTSFWLAAFWLATCSGCQASPGGLKYWAWYWSGISWSSAASWSHCCCMYSWELSWCVIWCSIAEWNVLNWDLIDHLNWVTWLDWDLIDHLNWVNCRHKADLCRTIFLTDLSSCTKCCSSSGNWKVKAKLKSDNATLFQLHSLHIVLYIDHVLNLPQ